MLQLVEGPEQKKRSQDLLVRLLKRAWRVEEGRWVVWRPASEFLRISHNRRMWFCSVPPGGDQIVRRHWNSFGCYSSTGTLNITVEINIPTTTNSRRVSGFFARDPATDTVYLMHDGSVGGGRPGVGRVEFLSWSAAELVTVEDAQGSIRLGIVVAPLTPSQLAPSVGRFVERVAAFKEAVKHGNVDAGTHSQEARRLYNDYTREFSGKKRGNRLREIVYVSRHGDIVDELSRWHRRRPGERLLKNCYIDLGIGSKDHLRVLYEVKTSADRQSLYAGLGQLMVHGPDERTLRYLVVPRAGRIPSDVEQALKKCGIRLLTFEVDRDTVTIVSRR